MQAAWKSVYHQSLLGCNLYSKLMPRSKALIMNSAMRNASLYQSQQLKQFSTAAQGIEVRKTPDAQHEIETSKKPGVDMTFSEQKHSYVLTFPWNFPEIIQDYEQDFRFLPSPAFWNRFLFNTSSVDDINIVYRKFHQICALTDYEEIKYICEGTLAEYVQQSVKKINGHGLFMEMANLTVVQPKIRVLKAEVYNGLSIERKENMPLNNYIVKKSKFIGAPLTTYVPKSQYDTRSCFDHIDSDYKPYLVALTLLVESPMKLFVENQDHSGVLFGSNDEEIVKNVVRVEAKMKWQDFFKILPVGNKPSHDWKITDFNNALNENPYFINQ